MTDVPSGGGCLMGEAVRGGGQGDMGHLYLLLTCAVNLELL